MIKAMIFDLDDTLFDQRDLRKRAIEQGIKAMIENGLKCNFEQGLEKFNEIIAKNPLADKFTELGIFFNRSFPYNNRIINIGKEAYLNADFNNLEVYPEVIENLKKLKKSYKLFLITNGYLIQQNKKIDSLKIRYFFDKIFINENNNQKKDKTDIFKNILQEFNLSAKEIIVVGDRIDSEIKVGNELGMTTVRVLRGIYGSINPREKIENPNFEIKSLNEIYDVIAKINNQETNEEYGLQTANNKNNLKIVAIGGGTGLPTIAEGLRKYTDNLTLIVTVTDSGRSSGILRKELNVLPPGDIRNCLIALSNSEQLMCDLFQYRFENSSLLGHNFGNLFIAALTKLTGSFELAIEETSKILKLKGKVLPSTLDNIHICAELENGDIIEEENKIIDRHNENVHLRSPIKKVFLKPKAIANPKALEAISEADLIVLSPGSLFTSIITNLLVDGIPQAINNSKAKKVYICNIMTQVSQTYRYKVSDHLKFFLEYLNGKIDYIIVNNEKPRKELLDSYAKENAFLVENDCNEIESLGVKVISLDLLDHSIEKKPLWEKKNLLRHDPDKIARVLIDLVDYK